MKRISEAYEMSKRESKFINDLIYLDVSDLLLTQSNEDDQSIQKSFVDMVCNFIQRNALKDIILGEVVSIMVCIYVCNYFV